MFTFSHGHSRFHRNMVKINLMFLSKHISQDSIHLLDVLLSQAIALNLNYECIGRSYYFPTPGSVLDIGFGKEVFEQICCHHPGHCPYHQNHGQSCCQNHCQTLRQNPHQNHCQSHHQNHCQQCYQQYYENNCQNHHPHHHHYCWNIIGMDRDFFFSPTIRLERWKGA